MHGSVPMRTMRNRNILTQLLHFMSDVGTSKVKVKQMANEARITLRVSKQGISLSVQLGPLRQKSGSKPSSKQIRVTKKAKN